MVKRLNTEEFVKRSIEAHGDRYDYTNTVYKNARTKVDIICKVHGVFSQATNLHLNGSNCPKCVGLEKMTTESFIEKANSVHSDRYDYSLVNYTNNKTDVTIICPEHGEFKQKPNNHLSGHGCRSCGNNTLHTLGVFLSKAKEAHGDTYSYHNSTYLGLDHKVTITCPVHGDFTQTAAHHINGSGCPECKSNFKLNTKTFIEKANKVHGNKYTYADVAYVDSAKKVIICCPEHGDFVQTASCHLMGYGCPDCGGTKPHTTESFIAKAIATHGDKYDYSKVKYVNAKTKVTIVCPDHGEFHQQLQTHIDSQAGCPKCAHIVSKAEQSIADTLRSHGLEVLQSNRSILGKFELDIVLPEKKVAIEFNGMYWHSEANGKDRYYHRTKTDLANEAGYRLIHIWEDDFNEDPEREINFILNACGLTSKKMVYARKTTIGEVGSDEAARFLKVNHVQGSVGASVKLGTYHEGELVAVTLFAKRNYGHELVRHAASVTVIGGLGKVVKHFHREHNTPIHSFCDISRHDGKSYESAGFVKSGELKPDYKYVINGKREHKFGFRLASIKTKFPEVYSEAKTEREMMEEAGIPRVWDCGKVRYVFS